MKRFLFALGLAFATACHEPTGPSSTVRDLSAAKDRWSKRGFTDYSFTLRTECFCAVVDPIRVTVVHDTVQSAIDVKTSQPVDVRLAHTVDGLFGVVDNDIKNNFVVEAMYESTLGYPLQIVSNGPAMVADVGVIYTVSDFARN